MRKQLNTWGDTSLSEFPRDINWDDTNIFVFFEASFLIEEASQVAQWFKKKKKKKKLLPMQEVQEM